MKAIFLLLALSTPHVLAAQWSVEVKIDAMTDDTVVTAYVTNEDGYKLSVYKVRDEESRTDLWATFSLPDDNADVLSSEELPIFRVDKNEPRKLSGLKYIQDQTRALVETAHNFTLIVVEPKWVNFLFTSPAQEQFVKGEAVVFRFWLFTGGYKDTTFTLLGVTEAIARVTGS